MTIASKAPSERELSRKRLRESACTKRFGGSAVKISESLFPQSPPPLRGSVSLRLGHGAALTTHRVVIHYRAVTSLPLGGSLGRDRRVFRPRILTKVPFVMSVSLQISQTIVGNIAINYVQTLDQLPFKFFWFFSRKKRTEKSLLKLTPQINF